MNVEEVYDCFYVCYNFKVKIYLYKIWNEEYINLFMCKYSMYVNKKLNVKSMKVVVKYLVGLYDFIVFLNVKLKKKFMV